MPLESVGSRVRVLHPVSAATSSGDHGFKVQFTTFQQELLMVFQQPAISFHAIQYLPNVAVTVQLALVLIVKPRATGPLNIPLYVRSQPLTEEK